MLALQNCTSFKRVITAKVNAILRRKSNQLWCNFDGMLTVVLTEIIMKKSSRFQGNITQFGTKRGVSLRN